MTATPKQRAAVTAAKQLTREVDRHARAKHAANVRRAKVVRKLNTEHAMTYQEIAAALEVSETTVTKLVRLAKSTES